MSTENALKIFVGNLPFSATPEHLSDLFSPYGEIQGINIRKDPKTNNPRGFAFVTFTSEQAALDAIAAKSGSIYAGRELTVGPATQRGSAGEANSNEDEDDSWKTAPPPRGGKISSSSSSSSSSKGKGKAKAGTEKRSWDQWAGPSGKEEKK